MDSFTEYQDAARRTQRRDLDDYSTLCHAVFGLTSEAGEVSGILQKIYQGHAIDKKHLIRELGDCLWMISEACDVLGVSMGEVAEANILKLKARYPEGFDAEHSLCRKEGDI